MTADRSRIVSGGRLAKSLLQMTFGGKVGVGATNLVANRSARERRKTCSNR